MGILTSSLTNEASRQRSCLCGLVGVRGCVSGYYRIFRIFLQCEMLAGCMGVPANGQLFDLLSVTNQYVWQVCKCTEV